MAKFLVGLALKSQADIWIVGYSNLQNIEESKQNKLSISFQEALNEAIQIHPELKKRIYVFQHPSNNNFARDIFDALIKNQCQFSFDKLKKIGRGRAEKYFDVKMDTL